MYVQGVPCISPKVKWDRLQPHHNPDEDTEDGWMDAWKRTVGVEFGSHDSF